MSSPLVHRTHRRWWRRLAYLGSAGLVGWAAVVVPMPVLELAPGTAPSVAELVSVADADTTPLSGDIRLLTVVVDQPSLLGVVRTALDPTRELIPQSRLIAPGVDPEQFFREQRERFRRSVELAAALGLELAGYDAQIRTAVQVVAVLPGAPAAGVLRPGDVVTAVDGRPVRSADDLAARTRAAELGQELTLTIRRGDRELTVTATVGTAPGMDRPGLGVLIETTTEVTLPVEVDLTGGQDIGGPSAGLVIALTIYDLVSDEDLTRGRIIAGTGELLPDGSVAPVGGIPEKVIAAEQAGAEVLLVPAPQADEARAARTREDLVIIGVASLREAVEALRR